MTVSRQVLGALLAAAGVVRAADGPAFSTGPTASGVRIQESWATLNLPDVPTDNSGDLSLWVGMGTSNGDLIQSIAENYNEDDWSVYAYTLMETSSSSQTPIQADGSTTNAGTAVTFHYVYDSSSGNYTQEVIVNSQVVSSLSTSDGDAEGWGSAVECAAEDCGTVPAHTWTNVSITLSAADASYSDTLALGTDVTGSMSTSDGGITWEVGTICIPSWDFSSESVVGGSTCASSTSTSSSSSASASATAASSGSYGASPSGVSSSSDDSSSSSSYSSGGSSTGSYSASSSGTPSSGYGSGSGSSTGSSSGASASGGYGSGSYGSGSYGSGSSTGSSSGAQPSGTFGSGGGSSSWGSSGAQPSGGFGGGDYGSGFSGHSHNDFSWKRSRIYRPGHSSGKKN